MSLSQLDHSPGDQFTIGLRVKQEIEADGLDISHDGEVVRLKHIFGYDDALDAVGGHAAGGAAGAILTGVLAIEPYGGTAERPD